MLELPSRTVRGTHLNRCKLRSVDNSAPVSILKPVGSSKAIIVDLFVTRSLPSCIFSLWP